MIEFYMYSISKIIRNIYKYFVKDFTLDTCIIFSLKKNSKLIKGTITLFEFKMLSLTEFSSISTKILRIRSYPTI